MNETVQQFLLNFAPALTVLVGLITAGVKLIGSMKNILKQSNVESVLQAIEDEKSSIADNVTSSKELVKELIRENAELKKAQQELLEEFTKVKKDETNVGTN